MKTRNSNLEILRIISMIMIIAHHYAVHGFSSDMLSYGANRYIVDILSLGGKLGVNIFVLISGYFMVKSIFTIKKLLIVVGQTYFYALGILILFTTILTPVTAINKVDIKKSIFSLSYGSYWFVTCYVVLMILSPYINILIDNMSKKMHQRLIWVLMFVWVIVPSVFMENLWKFNELGWFVALYIIAAYIRKYIDLTETKYRKNVILALMSSILLVLSVVIMGYVGQVYSIGEFLSKRRWYSGLNSVLVVVLSVELLLVFLRMKKREIRIINIIASAMFGVYLIHDNFILRPYIWRYIFKNQEMYGSQYLIVHAICTISIIFVVCTIIDLIRKYTVEKIGIVLYDKYANVILKRWI